MKKYVILVSAFLVPTFCFGEEPSSAKVAASCNIQMGQTLSALGQAQQQIIDLQTQIANLQKKLDQNNESNEKSEKPN